MIAENLKCVGATHLFGICLAFLVSSICYSVYSVIKQSLILLHQSILSLLISSRMPGKNKKSLYSIILHKKNKKNDVDAEQDVHHDDNKRENVDSSSLQQSLIEASSSSSSSSVPQKHDDDDDVKTKETTKEEQNEDESSVQIVDASPEPDLPVPLAFEDCSDSPSDYEEVIMLRDKVNELTETLTETQTKLSLTRKALLMKTEHYKSL